ncbi:Acetoacetyl-CoA reductase [Pontiella desulfatans]|uniref:Acetoacetyl-CoA reductase n=1 Tax=Pontiella desulfatans TaxID=2750659 RepID=A0A6C2U960_PONDE|nr:SDR family NAD(P)-dependent oxidoreductase [Pontiella desulfatans]VGO16515.1 Acetoacetyl-CoA reductase [Pontiella desulfatans]
MNRKTVIITGANSGIGKAAAQRMAAEGHRIVLACRNPDRAEAAQREIGEDTIVGLVDLSRRASIHAFTDWAHRELGEIDVLINNAADFDLAHKEREMTADGFERIWFTNHLAPVLLADRLMDRLVASPQGRIINVSSMGLLFHPFLTVDLKDPMFNQRTFSVAKAYYQSKLAQLMYTLWLSRQLSGTMATANCIRVSNVRLDLDRFPDLPQWMKNLYAIKARFSITPEQMAETYAQAALNGDAGNQTGQHIGHPFKETGIPVYAKDPLCIEQVMQLTYKQLGIRPSISYEQPETG